MKKITLFLGFCFLLIWFNPIFSLAQEATPPPYLVVFEEFVSPADLPDFRTAQDKVIELWKKYNMDIPIWTYHNDDNAFYWVIPLANFGGLDELYGKMMGWTKQLMEEEGYDTDKEFRDLSTGRQTVLSWSPELSYHPSGNYGQTTDKPYVEWMFCYLKAGHEKEVAAAAKKYIEFYNRIDESYEWDIYAAMLGHDTPMWIFMTRDKSPIAMRKLEVDLSAKYKTELQKLWLDFSVHIRKFENKTGWFMPQWSMNLPE